MWKTCEQSKFTTSGGIIYVRRNPVHCRTGTECHRGNRLDYGKNIARNAHGTSTPLGDKAETLAVKAVFGGRESAPPMSSTKSATGHLMGAGGLTEAIACIKAIEEGVLPPTLHLAKPDPECDLDYVPNTARKAEINAAMSNLLGFGGQNSSLIVAKYEK